MDTTQESAPERRDEQLEENESILELVEDIPDPRIVLAQAIHELAAATRLRAEQRTTKLKLMTPSTGGELELEWDPTCSDEEFATYLTKELFRRESALKGCLKMNADLGIGAKSEKKAGGA